MVYPRAGTLDLLKLLGGFRAGLFRSQAAREAEMAFLRLQLLVLKRSAPARLRLRTTDRLIFVWLYRLFPSLLGAAVIFKPPTLVRWHRSGFRLYWRWKSRRRVGRSADRLKASRIIAAMSVSTFATAPKTCRLPSDVSTLPTRTSRCRSPSWQLRMKVEWPTVTVMLAAAAAGLVARASRTWTAGHTKSERPLGISVGI